MGILSKALVGLGAGVQQKAAIDWEEMKQQADEDLKRELMRVQQQYQTSERQATETFQAGQTATQIAAQSDQTDKQIAAAAQARKDDNAAADSRLDKQLGASASEGQKTRDAMATDKALDRQQKRMDDELSLSRNGGVSSALVTAATKILTDPDSSDSDKAAARSTITRAQTGSQQVGNTGTPMFSQDQPASPSPGAPIPVFSQADVEKLATGTKFTLNGKTYVKN